MDGNECWEFDDQGRNRTRPVMSLVMEEEAF
jgi:hypothetical protein